MYKAVKTDHFFSLNILLKKIVEQLFIIYLIIFTLVLKGSNMHQYEICQLTFQGLLLKIVCITQLDNEEGRAIRVVFETKVRGEDFPEIYGIP